MLHACHVAQATESRLSRIESLKMRVVTQLSSPSRGDKGLFTAHIVRHAHAVRHRSGSECWGRCECADRGYFGQRGDMERGWGVRAMPTDRLADSDCTHGRATGSLSSMCSAVVEGRKRNDSVAWPPYLSCMALAGGWRPVASTRHAGALRRAC